MIRSKFRAGKMLLVTLSLGASAHLAAAEPTADKPLAQAVSALHQGDPQAAHDKLSEIIASGTSDARVFYYHGLASEALGQDGTDDFAAGAKLEVAQSSARLVNEALEKTQGPLRTKIERIRTDARNAFKTDPARAQDLRTNADGLDAFKRGDLETAQSKFSALTTAGSADARAYYMHGVVLAKQGDLDGARAMFRDGLAREIAASNVKQSATLLPAPGSNSAATSRVVMDHSKSVSHALEFVQGDIRRILEEEVAADVNNQKISRQAFNRELLKQAATYQEQLFAASDQQRAEMIAQIEQAQREREKTAAAAIESEEKKQAELEAALKGATNPTDSGSEAPMPETSIAANSNNAAPNETTTPDPADTEPTTDSTKPAVNPFLSSGSGSKPATVANAINTAWIDPAAELVIYVRPSDLMASGFMKPLMNSEEAQKAFSEMSGETGFTPADIESVTFGMSNFMARMMSIGMQVQGAGGQPNPEEISRQLLEGDSGVAVIRSKIDIDFAKLSETSGAEAITHGDATYYKLPQEGDAANAPVVAVYPVDAKTYLFGTEIAITTAIDRGPGEEANGMFGFVGGDTHFALIFANPTLPLMSSQIPDNPQSPPFAKNLMNAVRGKVTGTALTVNAANNLTIGSVISLNDPASGTAAASALDEGIAQAKQFSQFLPQMGQIPQPMIPVMQFAIDSMKSTANGGIVKAEITIPASIIKVIQDNPGMFQQMVPPIQGGPGAAPGFGPPGVPGAGGPIPPAGGNPSSGFGFPQPGQPAQPGAAAPPGASPPALQP